jgi:acetolactate synthase regulatory subunit
MIRALSPPNAGPTELTLTVEFADDTDDALLRVLSTLHRRRCRVTAAEFAGDRSAPGHLALRIQAPPAYASRVAYWLNSLIDVRHVRTTTTGERASQEGAETYAAR